MHAAPASNTPLHGSDQPSGCPAIPVLLAEFFCPQAVTLPHILASHNISPEQLLAWIKDPRNQATISAIHELNNLRRDFAISHARTDSLGVLLGIQERFRKQMETTSDGFGVSDRLTESARKASLHLLAVTGDLKSPPPPAQRPVHASDRGPARSLSDDPNPAPTPPPPAQRVRERSGRGQGRVEESPWRPTGFASSPTPSTPSPDPNSHADAAFPPAQRPVHASDRGPARSLSQDPNPAPTPPSPEQQPARASDRGSARSLSDDPAPTPISQPPARDCSAHSSPNTPALTPLPSDELFRRVEALLRARTQQRSPQQPSGP